ncbi:hypothetical protein ING2E5A_2776 [Petrimonas mucosa]|jgi:hypothetical protein|uniref:Uncharacterized protein n=1 Tax=Petrimonas mucosa TaxID=1642646 RepID=A0A1G4GAR0_9BACT|nr:hypothetical protein ING2E5A_2776 [Petrimonas mucosa]
MENLMVYLAKATICLIAFSVFFRLLLMRETFFRFYAFHVDFRMNRLHNLTFCKTETESVACSSANCFSV